MALAYFLCQAMALVCFFPEKKIHKKLMSLSFGTTKDKVETVRYPVGDSDYRDDTNEILKLLNEKDEIVNISSDEEEDVDHDNEETD